MSIESDANIAKLNDRPGGDNTNRRHRGQLLQAKQADLLLNPVERPEISETGDGGFRLHIATQPASDLPDRCLNLLSKHGLKYKSMSISRDPTRTPRHWVSILTKPCSMEAARRFVAELRTSDHNDDLQHSPGRLQQ